jgi:DNA-binding MarR family transcriptional regulator
MNNFMTDQDLNPPGETAAPGDTRETPETEEFDRGLLEDLLGYHLRRAEVFAFQSFGATGPGHEGVSPGQLGVLLMVQANPGINQTGAGRALGIDRSTLVSIIDALEDRALIERTPSPTDRRSHALLVTAKGDAFLKRIRPRLDAHEDELVRNLSAVERATLIDLLRRIVSP